jgi:hypothetical protein
MKNGFGGILKRFGGEFSISALNVRRSPFTSAFGVHCSMFCVLFLSAADGAPLDARLDVESRLPVYLNRGEVVLVFDRKDERESMQVEVSFAERSTGHVPAAPVTLRLTGTSKRHEQVVDISSWPDGQYKASIREAGASAEKALVRAIIKQTLAAPVPPQGVIDMGGVRMLFVDDWHLAQTTGLVRRVRPPEMIPVEPWKSRKDLDYPRNSILDFYVDVNGDLNVRISASRKPGGGGVRYWARSRDLKTWEAVDAPAQRHPACLLINPGARSLDVPRPAPGRVYRRYDPAVDGTPDIAQVRVYFTGTERGELDWGGVTVPRRSMVAVWEQPSGLHLVLGSPVTRMGSHPQGAPKPGDIGDWTQTNDNFGTSRLSADGRVLRFWQTRRIPRHAPFSAQYDNLLFDRILTTWSSRDGLNWTPTVFDAPTPEDPWGTQHYGMDAWWEENRRLELAYYQSFDVQRQQMTTALACSRDGILWTRIDPGTPFLGNGALGEWNFGFSRTTGIRQRLLYGNDYYEVMQGVNVLHFMFMVAVYLPDRAEITAASYASRFGGRMVGEHGIDASPIMKAYGSWDKIVEATKGERSTPGVLRYRKDRWVGISPENREGAVTTKTFRAPGHTLAINAATREGGRVLVELLDAQGNPLDGYSGTNAAVFAGDETGAELRWAGGRTDRLPAEPFALSVRMEDAELYALEFLEPVALTGGDGTAYGVCEHTSFTTDHARSERVYALMREAGIGMTRTDFHWGALAGKDAQAPLDFANFDRVVETAKRSGMGLLPIVTHSPGFAHPLYERLDLWRGYVRGLVSRYAKDMRYWEIWNEHNFEDRPRWGEKADHAANYTKTLRAAYEEIKAIDPALTVVYGGTAHVPLDYIEKTLQCGAGACFDVMNVHPYGSSTLPEAYLFEQMRGLKALMAKYGQEKKAIWATEIGWPTVVAQRPWLYKAVLPKALGTLGIDPGRATLGVLYDVENDWLVQSPAYDIAGNFPAFQTVRKVRLAELAALDPAECPVLVPCREEIFPRAFFGDLVEYVRRGGTLILPQGIPFGYDKPVQAQGRADPAPYLGNMQKALHIEVNGYWSMGIKETETIEVPGVTPPDAEMKNARFLGERHLEAGDTFAPLAFGVAEDGKRYPFAGVYRLNSSLKGNVVVFANREDTVREEVSRDWQGMILPRAYLILLAEGVEKVFWYKLTNSGEDADGDRERNFGVLDKALSPKPAYRAYAELIRQCPPGSSRPVIVQENGVYRAEWTRPDGTKVCAAWTAEGERSCTVALNGRFTRAVNHLGGAIEARAARGEVTLTAGPGITYLESCGVP